MHFNRFIPYTLFFFLFFLNRMTTVAQTAQDQFGKNRIQYKKFDWKHISTENFDIYYYFEGEGIAPIAATHAESVFHKLETSLGYSNMNKTKVLIYNSLSDLQQSNIGLQQGTFVGGQTNLVKATVEIAFNGDLTEFREDLTYGIAKTWINIILYGGSFKEVVQSSYFLSLPEWYIRGASRYIAAGWDREMDNFMRDLAVNHRIGNPSSYTGQEAEWIGQSIWHYISDKYGRDMATNILQTTRIYRSERSAIESSTGVYYTSFIQNWKNYYIQKALALDGAVLLDSAYKSQNGHNARRRDLSTVSISKDGKYMAYSSNHKGKYRVVLKNIQTGKKKIIYSGGFKLNDQIPVLRNPLLAWQNETNIAFIIYKKGKIIYRTYNVKDHSHQQRVIDVFHQINSLSYSSDGNLIVFSADEKGQSDIWMYDIERARYSKITTDEYDDHSPRFGPGNSIIFSSNRSDDTLTVTRFESAPTYSLFIYKPGTKVLQRIPAQSCNYTQPMFWDPNTIVYVSDKNGVLNLYKQDLVSGKELALTNNITDIIEYELLPSKKYLSFIARSGGEEHVYLDTLFSINHTFPSLPKTDQSVYALTKKATETDKPKRTNNLIIISKPKVNTDDIDLDKVYFESDTTKKPAKKNADGSIAYLPPKRKIAPFYGPYDYTNLFGTDQVATTLKIDPLRGFGLLIESNMSDLMSNHRVNMGIFGLADLKSSSLFGEYQYLKKRIDYGFRFDRITYFANNSDVYQKYVINKVALTASYPLSVYSRLSVSPFALTNRYSDLSDLGFIAYQKDVVNVYTGLKGEFVYDNTTTFGLNMLEGTRAKVLFESYRNTTTSNRNFNRINIDVRHYHRLHKGIVLALRGSYGRFFGQSPKSFVFGGMDNWLFNSTDQTNSVNPLGLASGVDNSDIMFAKYVTNVRGFKYNAQSGNSYFLFNAELRIPIIQYLYSGTVSSAFLRNLQLVAFTDIGASWYGVSPFSSNNSLNTKNISSGNLDITVTNYRSPFLYGYGFGARTLFLGYYMKLDVAWGIKDSQQLSTRYYITFGYDF